MDCNLKERMEECDLKNKQFIQCDVVEEQGGREGCE